MRYLFLIAFLLQIQVALSQNCTCPSAILNNIPTYFCENDASFCIELNDDLACIDTFYFEFDDPQIAWFASLDPVNSEICISFGVNFIFGFCDVKPLNIDLTIECTNGESSTYTIPPISLYPMKGRFALALTPYIYNQCNPIPQFSEGECPGIFTYVFTEGNNDGCGILTDGKVIWTATPVFDYTGAEECYEPLESDTILIAPCPVYPFNGDISIKVKE